MTSTMMVASFLVATVATAALANRTPLESDIPIAAFSSDWIRGDRADSNTALELTLALHHSSAGRKAVTAHLLEASDPRSPTYGTWLTKNQVDQLVAPTTTSVRAVWRFLEANGIAQSSCTSTGNGDVVRCGSTVGTAERMFSTTFHSWKHRGGNQSHPLEIVRASKYCSLPSDDTELVAAVELVSPCTRFPVVQGPTVTKVASVAKEQHPDIINTPKSLRQMYSVGDVEGKPGTGNRMAATGFLKQHFKQSDLTEFWKTFYPKAVGRKINVVGPDAGLGAGVEASLDVQYISSMGGGVEAEFWSYAGAAPDNPKNEPFLDWILQMANTSDADVPKVFSTSYGEPETSVSMAYMGRIEAEFQKTAVRGISLLFASGDSGVGQYCTNTSTSPNAARFDGNWPAGSPWVTGVGGTEGGGAPGKGLQEKAWGGSSGGFSDRWPRPDFQKAAVDTYLSTCTSLPASSFYNGSSRGFPDVSAQSTGFLVVADGLPAPVAGTSAASPTFAGILALLNDLRLQKNKSTLGWVNPFFYQNPQMFQDIVEGANNAGIHCGGKGFDAIKGWDPVTGLGTPNYAAMAKAVLSLP